MWLGLGHNTFRYHFAEWQSNYFARHPIWNDYHLVADTTGYAYNEFLNLWIEHGFFALISLISFFAFSFIFYQRNPTEHNKPFMISQLVILVYSLSYFPLHDSYVVILSIINFWILIYASFKKASLIISPLCIASLIFIINEISLSYKSKMNWTKATEFSLNNQNDSAMFFFKLSYNNLNKDPYFLKDFYEHLKQVKSDTTQLFLSKNSRYMDQYEVNVERGNYFFYKKEYKNSILYFTNAHNILPNRLYPLYYLMVISQKTNNTNSLSHWRDIILKTPIKVSSPLARYIKQQAMLL